MTLMLNEKETAKCLVYFTIGYAIGDAFENENIYSGNYRSEQVIMPSKSSMSNTFRMGLEARYNPKPELNLTFGLQYKYARTSTFPGSEINEFNTVGVYIKTGLNFLHKTTPLKKS